MSWLLYLRDMSIFALVSSAIVFGLYYIARWLRSRGQGARLDALAGWHERMTYRGALHTLGALRTLHSMPLYGSRQQRETIDMLIVRVQRHSDAER